jgi:hypothetical protein
MALLTSGIAPKPYGGGGRKIDLPVKASTQLFQGQMVAFLGAGLVPGSTAGAGDAVGIVEADALGGASDGLVRCMVWTDHTFTFNNGTNALTDAFAVGSLAYMEDDHTVGTGGVGGSGEGVAGLFMGMNDDGTVRVYMFPNIAGTLQNVLVNGSNLANTASQTVQSLGRNTRYTIPAISQTSTVTLGTTGAKVGDMITISRTDSSAFTLAVANGGGGGGTIVTLDVSKQGFARAYFDGTNWKFDSAGIA